MLGNTRMADSEAGLEMPDIDFTVTQFLNQPNAVGVGEKSEQLSQFSADDCTRRHMNTCIYLHVSPVNAREILVNGRAQPFGEHGSTLA